MARKDPRVDVYIEHSAPFARPVLKHLRKIVHAGCPKVEETMKWSRPHFEYKGVMCGMAAFKEHCSFCFWKAKVILPNNSEEEAMGQFGRIRSIADLPDEATLIKYVTKAAELNAAGTKAPGPTQPRTRPPLKVPSYFQTALNKNAKAKKTFEGFSPSHRREYLEWITEAKREETRQQRIKTALQWLAERKARNWKYM